MASDLELLTVGRISIDLYCDQLGADWHAARSFSKAVGGSPTNVAIAAARLGHRARRVHEGRDRSVRRGRARRAARLRRRHPLRRRVEPGTVTPLAFAVLDPPEDPQLLFRRDPPVPDFQLRPGEVDDATVSDVPILWISGGALSQEPSGSTVEAMLRARGRRRAHGARPRLPPDLLALARGGLGADRRGRHARHGRGRQPRGVRGRGGHRRSRARRRTGCSSAGIELAIVKLGGDGVLLASDQASG